MFGVTLLLGRMGLPLGVSFGFNSCARNLGLLLLGGVLLRAPGMVVKQSTVGRALLLFLFSAALSIAVNHGGWSSFRVLAAALGIFYVVRLLSAGPRGSRWVFHWLGCFAVAVLVREVASNPFVLTLREQHRFTLVTDNANTLGVALALLAPIFLAGTVRADRRIAAWIYAAASGLMVAITFSRTAWAALLLGVVALGLSQARRAAIGTVTAAIVASATVAAAAGYVSLGRTEADLQRLRIIEVSMSLFHEHWLAGIGYGSGNLERLFPVRYLERYGESLFLFHSHNLYVDVLTGTGVIGAAAAVYLVMALIRVAWQGVERATGADRRLEALAYVISVGIFLLVGIADMPLYHGRLIFLLAVIWGAMESASLSPRSDVQHPLRA